MTARQYGEVIVPRVQHVVTTQLPAIEVAGALVARSIGDGHRVWVSQTSHTLHLEATHRAGGFMAVHVLEDLDAIEAGDVLLIGTSAGTSAGPVDIAIDARRRAAFVVALTQLDFETDPRMVPEHPTGQLLYELADVVIDLGGPFGDGEFELPGTDVRILPSSGATGVVAMWMIFAEAVDRLVADGKVPLMWQSNLLPGAIARNQQRHDAYESTRVGFVADRVR